MMAKVLAIMLAVLMDKWGYQVPGGQVVAEKRTVGWVNNYIAKVIELLNTKANTKQGYLIILTLVAPLCICVLLLELLFYKLFGSIVGVLFVASLLFYFLGNNEAEARGSEFVSVHERSFGVLFWFAILGPVGALLYWFFVISQQSPTISEQAKYIHAVLAWVPARLTGFIYALVGNFTSGFSCWLNCMRTPAMASGQVLQDCGKASIDTSVSNDGANLVKRSFMAWVVLSVLIVAYTHKF